MTASHTLIDVAVIGGGAAGLNAALMLARVRRNVLVIDSGTPRNAPAAGIHGLLGNEGTRPTDLLQRGRTEVRQYGGKILDGEVVRAQPVEPGPGGAPRFEVGLADGTRIRSRRILVATGIRDEIPEIPGLAEHWGNSVVHCPFCHGWEVRDRAIGVIATRQVSFHQALMFRSLTDDLMVFTTGGLDVDADTRARFDALGVRLIGDGVQEVVTGTDGVLTGVRLRNTQVVPRDALAVVTTMTPRLDGLEGLGLPLEELPGGMGQKIATGVGGISQVPGVWAAGNAADPSAQVGMSAASGALAGGHISALLAFGDADAAMVN